MASNFHRYFFTKIRRSLPSTLRSLRHYYFYTFSVASLICLVVLIPVFILTDQVLSTWTSLVCAILIALTLGLWRLGVPLCWVQFFFQVIVTGSICFSAYHSGGMTSPVMFWLGIVPILPMFTASRRWSYAWLLFSFVSLVLLYLAQLKGLVLQEIAIAQEALTFSTTMIGLLCITQAILFMLYDAANAQSARKLQQKNRSLKTLSHDLHIANIQNARFLSTVSHEIRTPLNAVMGYMGLLRNATDLTRETSNYVRGADSSANHLLTVINDLLDYAQIQQGKLVLTYQPVNLCAVLNKTFQSLAPKASQQGIGYVLYMAPDIPPWVHTDRHRLVQIFSNLLSNALKFTTEGSVVVHIFHKSDPHEPRTSILSIKVHDSGIGIPESAARRIFEPFFQLETPPSLGDGNALKGNGLGLAITQCLVQSLGGFIHLTSQEGIGSCFEVQLPINSCPSNARTNHRPLNPSNLEGIYLLIVDDHTTNRLVASATIKRELPDTRIDEASNGTEAIALMKTRCYDLVLMDLLMPDFSGVEVVRRIRAECAAPHRDVKVIALTAYVSEDALNQCKEVGIKTLLPKPFDRAVLIQTVLQYTT